MARPSAQSTARHAGAGFRMDRDSDLPESATDLLLFGGVVIMDPRPLPTRGVRKANRMPIRKKLSNSKICEPRQTVVSRNLAPQVKQRVFDSAETLEKILILNGLLKFAKSRNLPFEMCSTWLPGSCPKPTRRAENGGKR
jgi:hypothetical protein